ncbi:MAG TPA: hypothetical protein PLS48_11180 [Methanotrichaceae archaeon]|nr:hypothetical protein [Methanotrichaceae archaeon]
MQIKQLTHSRAFMGRSSSLISLGALMALSAYLFILIFITSAAAAQEIDAREIGSNLSLDIYLYDTGKTLVTGYADNIDGLIFLEPDRYEARYTPKYSYENETGQLYAWTDALTLKNGRIWNLTFKCWGFYNNFHIAFHLPSGLMLGRINGSKGLNYIVLTSNEYLEIDFQGYSVRDPITSIEYIQPMEEQSQENIGVDGGTRIPFQSLGLLLIITIGFASAYVFRRHEDWPRPTDIDLHGDASSHDNRELIEKPSQLGEGISSIGDRLADIDDGEYESTPVSTKIDGVSKNKIEVNDKMRAVMETLTPRERAILETLIKYGGRMTQLEIRHEINSPKSSISMILISLEKRRLITKKEAGRTNILELSEWFISEK